MSIQYRMAAPEEWDKVASVWKECFPGKPCPSAIDTAVAVAEEDGSIVGFLVAQTIAHIDQYGIAPSHRGGKVSFGSLLHVLEEEVIPLLHTNGYVTFQTSPHDEVMAKNGYITPPWYVYRKMI